MICTGFGHEARIASASTQSKQQGPNGVTPVSCVMSMTLRLTEEQDRLLTALASAEKVSEVREAARTAIARYGTVRSSTAWQNDALPDCGGSARALRGIGWPESARLRLCWVATYVFYALNGYTFDAPEDEAYDLVIAAFTGHADIDVIAAHLVRWARSG
jgi:hypothetical protein